MIKVLAWDKQTGKIEKGDEKLLAHIDTDQNHYYWINLVGLSDAEEKDFLLTRFKIHTLAVSDIQHPRHPPKYEHFDNYNLLIIKVLVDDCADFVLDTYQLAMIFTDKYIITRADKPTAMLDAYAHKLDRKKHRQEVLPINIALRMARWASNRFIQHILTVEERMEELEDEMSLRPNEKHLAELSFNKAYLRKTRRLMSYHKDAFALMRTNKNGTINNYARHQLNDVYEHFERVYSLATLFYDTASDLIEGHLSQASHQLSQIIKILTIITAVFVPMTFIAGLYGMNFEYIPGLKTRYGYFIVLGIMISIGAAMVYIFRRNKWL